MFERILHPMALVVLAAGFLATTSAEAIYVDFADYQGAASGNRADIDAGGYSLTITSQPTRFDLSISRNGLGVSCTSGFWRCFTNSPTQIDAEWNEQITITFNDGPVVLNDVHLSRLYSWEVAVVANDDFTTAVRGRGGWWRRASNVVVGLGGIEVTEIAISARGWFSDVAVRGLDFDVFEPTTAIPEPHAALLFGAGIGLVALRRRR